MEENDLEFDGECQLRRVITAEGRSRGYINGRPVPMASLRALGELLVEIHGQHQHQTLLRRDAQREIIDDYGGHGETLAEVAAAFPSWRAARREQAGLKQAAETRRARLELLRYQVDELADLDLGSEELERLDDEHARLANAERLLQGGRQVVELLDDDDSGASAALARALVELEGLAAVDTHLEGARELVEGALIQLREGCSELRGELDRVELDPLRLAEVEERIGAIRDLARKHRVEPPELAELQRSLAAELNELEGSDQRMEGLDAEVERLAARYREAADTLGAQRRKAAADLGERVAEAMQTLGMQGGRFEAAVEARDDGDFAAEGLERIEFRVSANPGQPLKALAKVASGGELSRISLAIQVIIARTERIPTLIFDEVDSGVGARRQVLCVTHLPQVAAQAHHHLQVTKRRGKGITRTGIRPLEGDERVEEVARMLGGVTITEQSLAHAAEMIEGASG